jgi:hypothetical protein
MSQAMQRIQVDTSRFPLVVQTLYFGYTEADMRQALAHYEPLFARGERYAIAVHHEPGAPVGDAPMRAMIGTFQSANVAHIRACNVCVGVVLPSFSHRAALTALNWLFPPVAPQKACATLLEAVDYCCRMLTAEGIALGAPILQLSDELRRRAGLTGSRDELR